jgi:hypothetical protein
MLIVVSRSVSTQGPNTSFLLKMVCSYEMIQGVEMVSNIQPNFFALNVRRYGPPPSIFVRSTMTSPSEMRMKMG